MHCLRIGPGTMMVYLQSIPVIPNDKEFPIEESNSAFYVHSTSKVTSKHRQ